MADWEHRRRSARISTLDAWKNQQATCVRGPSNAPQNTSSGKLPQQKNGRKKRRLRPVEEVGISSVLKDVEQARENSKHENHTTNSDQPSEVPSATWMPEKRVFDLILDKLQKRDTHEIFSGPVNPEEVVGYYEIIKEPMDFGTMRAKLQEGMYTSLEQFEHDVFLISSNAMHFNSSTSIFYRQARAIHELAKKVFHSLRTDPEKFELEFTVTKRRAGKRAQDEAGSSNVNSPANLATNLKTIGMTIDVAANGRPCSSYGPPILRRKFQANPGTSNSTPHVDRRDHENHSERQRMYRPWTSFLNENEYISSTVYNSLKPLEHVNQGVVKYEESLMRFVKDLGPTAQTVANQKLQRSQVQPLAPNFQIPISNFQVPATSSQQRSTLLNSVINSATTQNSVDFCGPSTFLTNATDASFRGEVFIQNPINDFRSGSYLPTSSDRDLSFPAFGITNSRNEYSTMVDSIKLDNWVLPTELVSQTRLPELMSRNNNSPIVSSWPSQEAMGASSSSQASGSIHHFLYLDGNNQAIAASCPSNGVCSVQAGPVPDCIQPGAWEPQTVLDMPLLQSQLGEMNTMSVSGIFQPDLQLGLASERPAFDEARFQQRAPVHSHQTELNSEGLSLNAMHFLEKAPVHSHEAKLNWEGLSFNAMPFHEKAVYSHEAELNPEGLFFNAMPFHEKALVHSHEAEMNRGGLSFNAMRLQEKAPVHGHEAKLNCEGLSFNALPFHEMAPVHSHEAELNREELSFSTMHFHEKAQLHTYEAELNHKWLSFDAMRFHDQAELNPEGLSYNAMCFQEKVPVHIHRAELNSNGLSFNAMRLLEKAPVHSHEAKLNGEGLSFNALCFHDRAPVHGNQAEPSTQGFLDNHQPDLALQL